MQARLKGAIYPLSQYMVMWAEDRLKLFVDQSIGIDETNKFQLKFLI